MSAVPEAAGTNDAGIQQARSAVSCVGEVYALGRRRLLREARRPFPFCAVLRQRTGLDADLDGGY